MANSARLCPFLLLLLGFFAMTVYAYPLQGTASYYTRRSCRREGTSGVRTASRERYNENALTCAIRNKALFGRYLKITNLANGKSVIVRVNDFGPNRRLFRRGRIVDLSKAAFCKIANPKKGVIKVKIKIQAEDKRLASSHLKK